MAQSQTDIQKRSDEKRGVKVKSFKLSILTIQLIEQMAKEHGIAQNALITEAVEYYAQAPNIKK
jgi:predicted DNA-binding ribbon-helix-helix protein